MYKPQGISLFQNSERPRHRKISLQRNRPPYPLIDKDKVGPNIFCEQNGLSFASMEYLRKRKSWRTSDLANFVPIGQRLDKPPDAFWRLNFGQLFMDLGRNEYLFEYARKKAVLVLWEAGSGEEWY